MTVAYMDLQQNGDGVREVRELIGTAAELSTVDVSVLAPGSAYWATDTKTGYVLDGTNLKCRQ